MKRSADFILVLLLGSILLLGSCSSDALDETPSAVSTFITRYFPNIRLESYTPTADGGHKAKLDNSATIVFNKDNQWVEIDGEGVTLPDVLLYDQLPPALYSYLKGTEQQNRVYSMTRDNFYYKLTMLDTVITYTIATGAISYPGQLTGEEIR